MVNSNQDQTGREIRLAANRINLAGYRWHSGAKCPVLALHGWLDNAASFSRLAPLLTGIDLVALDLPGHGMSDRRPPGMHYHFVDFIPDILAAADSLGWQEFALLGHSMGAGIATLIAAAFPERINRLALIEGIGPWSNDPQEGYLHLAQATRQIMREERPHRYHHKTLEEAARARQAAGDLSYEAALILTRRGSRQDADGVRWLSDPRLRYRSPHYLSEQQVQAFLPQIKAPTLLLQATAEGPLVNHNWNERIALIPDIRSHKISGGHHLHLDNPQPVARILRPFFT